MLNLYPILSELLSPGTACDTTTSDVSTPSMSPPCLIFTVAGNANRADCVFPFFYNGIERYSCITDGNNDTPWCATTGNYDLDRVWGNCAGRS